MFDFKLGEYLLGPLVDAWRVGKTDLESKSLETMIREYARHKSADLPPDYFPKEVWYDYAAVVA